MEPTTPNYQPNPKIEAERQRFSALMNLSDEQLRIHNSNERVDFKADEIYSEKSPGLTSMLQERKLTEGQYYSAAFSNAYRQIVEGMFQEIASMYNQPERAMELLRKEFKISYDNWEYQQAEIKDLEEFLFTEKLMYDRRVQTRTAHTIGILENTLDKNPSSPLFGGASSAGPNLDQIERAMR